MTKVPSATVINLDERRCVAQFDTTTHSDSGLMKTEPMALATSVDFETVRQIAPEASAYASEKTTFSSGHSDPHVENRVLAGLSRVQSAIESDLSTDNPISREGIEHARVRSHGNVHLTRPMLSVVIPVFNERESVLKIVEAVKKLPITKQIIIVDDGSTDGTQESLLTIPQDGCVELFFHLVNQGKGAALQTGFRLAEGNIVIIQDADLEYDPRDIMKVVQPILDGKANVVYGSRYLNDSSKNSSWVHRVGNAALTGLSNWITGQRLTDMETCYKAFRREVLQNIQIEQQRFGFEPEITAKISRLGIQIPEVPIGYQARSWREGKKIGVKDLWNAIYCILRYR